MKLLIGTFCRLLWTLFVSGCDYYHEIKKLHRSLSTWDVLAIQEAFTVDKCRRIIWAIIDDGRALFRQKMLVQDFSDPEYLAHVAVIFNKTGGGIYVSVGMTILSTIMGHWVSNGESNEIFKYILWV